MRDLFVVLAFPLGIAGVSSWVMMVYALLKSKGAPTAEENRRWKLRYYKWVVLFVMTWAVTMLLFKLGK